MRRRFKFWDVMVVVALGLMVWGMSMTWWSLTVADMFGDLGLPGNGLLEDLTPGLTGFSTEVSGWDSPVAGLGIAAIVLTLAALAYAALKFSFPPRAPLPAWYKEGWVVTGIGSLCTLFGLIASLWVPFGGFAAWSWRPGSLVLLAGGVVLVTAGIVMGRDQTGEYQSPGRVRIIRATHSAHTRTSSLGSVQLAPLAVPMKQVSGFASYCGSCGTGLPRDGSFCPACGGRVKAGAAMPQTPPCCLLCNAPMEPGADMCGACGWRV